MRIGILGTGDVGRTLGTGFVELGHEVTLGSREAGNVKAREWAERTGGRGRAGTFAEAARFGELAVLATFWAGTENAIRLAGPENLAGKVVIDATNPLDFSQGVPPRLAVGHTDSGGEQVQRWLPGAHVVKAFNSVGFAHMVQPRFPCNPPTMFIAGDDDGAKRAVTDVCTAFGWETIDTGGMEGARLLEPLCMLFLNYAFRTHTWDHAFKLLRK